MISGDQDTIMDVKLRMLMEQLDLEPLQSVGERLGVSNVQSLTKAELSVAVADRLHKENNEERAAPERHQTIPSVTEGSTTDSLNSDHQLRVQVDEICSKLSQAVDKTPPPPKFDGKYQSINEWLHRIEIYQDMYALTDDVMKRKLLQALDLFLTQWYRQLPPMTFPQLKQKIRETFVRPSANQIWQELAKINMSDYPNLLEFVKALYMCFLNHGSFLDESIKLDYIISACPPDFGLHVSNLHLCSLDDLIREVVKYDGVKFQSFISPHRPPTPRSSARQMPALPTTSHGTARSRAVATNTNPFLTTSAATSTVPAADGSATPAQSTNQGARTRQCYLCGRHGHIAQYCTQRTLNQ